MRYIHQLFLKTLFIYIPIMLCTLLIMPVDSQPKSLEPIILIKFKISSEKRIPPGPYQLSVKKEASIISSPTSIVTDQENNIYILDTGNKRILKYNNAGEHVSTINTTKSNSRFATDLCINSDGDIFLLYNHPNIQAI